MGNNSGNSRNGKTKKTVKGGFGAASSTSTSPPIPPPWTGQQLRDAFPFDQILRYLIRDRDGIFGRGFRRDVAAMEIKEVLSTPRSPWERRCGCLTYTSSVCKIPNVDKPRSEHYEQTHQYHASGKDRERARPGDDEGESEPVHRSGGLALRGDPGQTEPSRTAQDRLPHERRA